MNPILYGRNDEERIVGLQLFYDDQKEQVSTMRIYTRDEQDRLDHYDDTLYPTIWLNDMSFLRGFPSSLYQFKELDGDNYFKYVVVFRSWYTMWKAVRKIKEKAFDLGITDQISEYPPQLYLLKTPEEQYLMQTGKTLFKGMEFNDIHRFRFDGEMYSSRKDAFPNAEREGDYIYIITAADNRGFAATYYVDDGKRDAKIDHSKVRNGIRFFSEEEMLRQFVKDIKRIDPDSIENHNIFAFDLPYVHTRLKMYGIPFNIGRDGSEPDVYESSKRFAERVIDFPHYKFAGRHVIDTMFETMNYDTFARDLPGYGLKVVSEYFGFAPEGRTYIEGDKLSHTWDTDPHAVLDYADDDVVEVSRLSEHLGGSTFFLTQMLPMSYQRAALAGTSTKIESLLVREYLNKRYSLPTRELGKQEVGGYTDLFLTGVYNNVIYADVASLYPSIMLNYDVAPEGDDLGLFKSLLQMLTDLRFETKGKMKQYEKGTEGHQKYNAMQASYKVMINSFYGQLGFSGSLFNDYSEADRVTVIGQQLLRQMIRLITSDGGEVVEVDTDGILTMAPQFVYTLGDEEDKKRAEEWFAKQPAALYSDGSNAPIDDESYVKQLTERMPEGIIIDFDGRAKRMMSYKKKNYAVREPGSSKDKIKGGSMVSRQYEPFVLKYIREVVHALMDRDVVKIAEIHREYLTMIQEGNWTPDDFRKRSRLKDTIETYIKKVKKGVGNGGRNKDAGYELALVRWEETGIKPEPGDTVFYYIGGNKAGSTVKVFEDATVADNWEPGMENKRWYTYRLQSKIAVKFKKFFTPEDFKLVFSNKPMEEIDFSTIEIQNNKVRRDYLTVVFVGPEGFGDDFWVERAVAGAKFLKTLDKHDHGYSIGRIVTTNRGGMDKAIVKWAGANGIPVNYVDPADVNQFGKMADRRTAIDLVDIAKRVAGDEMEVATIVIQDENSNNNIAYEVARIAETGNLKSHISTTV